MIRNFKALNEKLAIWSGASTNRRIFGAATLIGFLTIAVKAVSAYKEILIAAFFGVGDTLDAFVIALSFPLLLNTIIAGSLQYAFIPVYLQTRKTRGEGPAGLLLGNALFWVIVVLGAVALLNFLLAPIYLPALAAGFGPDNMDRAINLTRMLSPLLVVMGISGTLGAVLNSRERFGFSSITPVLSPIATISMFFATREWLGVYSLVAGTLLGSAMEAGFLAWALRRSGVSPCPRFGPPGGELRKVMSSYLPLVAGAMLMNGTTLIDNSMSAMLDQGSVSSLSYASKLIAFPMTLAVFSLGTAVFPYFARMTAEEDWIGLRNTMDKWLKLVFAVSIPLSAILFLFPRFFVRIFFERGAFTTENTEIVARVFGMLALQVPFYVASILVVRLISAVGGNKILMWASGLNLAVNVTMNYTLMKLMGVAGIALSTSCVYLISFAFLYFGLRRKMALHWDGIRV